MPETVCATPRRTGRTTPRTPRPPRPTRRPHQRQHRRGPPTPRARSPSAICRARPRTAIRPSSGHAPVTHRDRRDRTGPPGQPVLLVPQTNTSPTPRAETPEALGTPVRMGSHQVEVMPPHTNTGVTVAGPVLSRSLGRRKRGACGPSPLASLSGRLCRSLRRLPLGLSQCQGAATRR